DPLLTIDVPAHRSDVSRPEDIVEEVARVIGYETVPATLPSGTTPHVIRTDRLITREAAKDAIAAAGVIEIATSSFTTADPLERRDGAVVSRQSGVVREDPIPVSRETSRLTTDDSGLSTPYSSRPIVRLVNPMGEWEGMRPTLRASLLAAASENLKFVSGVAL